MQIEIGSLYYRWLTEFIEYPSNSVCILFWQNLYAVILSILIMVVSFFMLYGVLGTLLGMGVWLLSLGYLIDPNWTPLMIFFGTIWEPALVAGFIGWFFLIAYGIVELIKLISSKTSKSVSKCNFISLQYQLVRAKMKSRSSKFCPKVNYVHKGESND